MLLRPAEGQVEQGRHHPHRRLLRGLSGAGVGAAARGEAEALGDRGAVLGDGLPEDVGLVTRSRCSGPRVRSLSGAEATRGSRGRAQGGVRGEVRGS